MQSVHFGPVSFDYRQPRLLYRCFKEEAHAEALTQGKVWISTLDVCRQYENAMQGDPLEATNLYFSGPAISIDEPNGHEIARRSGIHLENATGGIISHNFCTTTLENAFILCSTMASDTEDLTDDFGHFVVEIRKPQFFLHRVADALKRSIAIPRYGLGPIEYTKPLAVGIDEIHPLGFVKRPEYAEQREFRFIWFTTSNNASAIKPFSVDVPAIVSLCRRIR